MSFSPRLRAHGGNKKSSWRKPVLIFVVLLALFLLGTVIVLSTVSYYFGVPSTAYLTEAEVPWRPDQVIAGLKDPYSSVEWTSETEPEVKADPEPAPANATDSDVWGVDGPGSGNYWMRKDWDGHVEGTHSWDRLYNVTVKSGEKAPRIIHQTWKNDVLPEKWRKAWKECREGHDDYEYMLWTDETAREFVAAHYPAQLHMYDNYRYTIQRADSIRYFILHHFGGIYMDLDIGCRRRMDPLLQGEWEVILPETKPVGVSNDLLISKPRSAFMDQTVHGLAAFNHQYVSNYPTVMFSTGPMFLSAQFSIYSASNPVTPANPHAHVRVLPKSLYGKNAPQASVPHSFFTHFYGSSWHSDDAGFITWLGKWGKGLMIVGAAVLVLGALRLLFAKTSQKSGLLAVLPFGNQQQYQLLPVGVVDGRASPSLFSGPLSPTFEPQDISSALRRAGNLILAAPAALTSNGAQRRQRGWLYFVPAMFHSQNSSGGARRRTASEASQLPLRPAAPMRPPPPYEGMEEVDEFLKEEDGWTEGKWTPSEGETSARKW